jgi:sorbitol/mannitol transport system permease protein
LPIVASIFPIYVYAEKWNLIGTRTILIVLYIAINLPLAIWMTRSFFSEVPRELIEAAEIDGTTVTPLGHGPDRERIGGGQRLS